jgi:hypothetical protein
MTLDELFNKNGSDKGTLIGAKHSYSPFYEKYLSSIKNESLLILEIGVCGGSSLKTWAEYCPNATIIGLDIDKQPDQNNERISTYILDQSDPYQLQHFVEECKKNNYEFDIILDDGSHHMYDQQITLGYFFPILKSKGIYFLEDLHTSLADNGYPLYNARLDIQENRKNTTLFYLMESFNSTYLSNEQNIYLQENIDVIEIHNKFNPNQESWCKFRSVTSAITKK